MPKYRLIGAFGARLPPLIPLIPLIRIVDSGSGPPERDLCTEYSDHDSPMFYPVVQYPHDSVDPPSLERFIHDGGGYCYGVSNDCAFKFSRGAHGPVAQFHQLPCQGSLCLRPEKVFGSSLDPLLGPVVIFCIICEVRIVILDMVVSSDRIIRSLRPYPATSLLESTVERC